MPEKILIVEDEAQLARFVELELQHEGYQADKAADGREGLAMMETGEYDLVLLDIMLPGLNGLEVLRRARRTVDTPVIMLTARDSVMDKVAGLDTGAEDYMTKPFEIEELLARIRVALRKGGRRAEKTRVLEAGALSMDVDRHTVAYDGQPVPAVFGEPGCLEIDLPKGTSGTLRITRA